VAQRSAAARAGEPVNERSTCTTRMEVVITAGALLRRDGNTPRRSEAASLGYYQGMCGQDLGDLYGIDELKQMLGSVGDDVSVNRSVVFYSPKNVHLGSNVRIDCFSVFTAGSSGIVIEDHVHIGAHCCLLGSSGKIHLESFTTLSVRTTVFTATDDYSDGFMTNPTVPDKYKKIRTGDVVLKRHAMVGCGSVLLPGVTLGVGASVGALSLVKESVPEFAIAAGIPVRIIGNRERRVLELEKKFIDEKQRRNQDPHQSHA